MAVVTSARARDLDLVAAVAAGGGLGALARFGVSQAVPHEAGHFPYATFVINVVGSALLGVLIVFASEVWPPRRLVRPFLGTGILGGFTTFSTYAVETRDLLAGDHVGTAAAYAFGSVLAALLAVRAATLLTRALTTGGQ